MSDKHDATDSHAKHATTVRASKGGGGKWLLGAAAAVVLLGGGYFAWKAMAPQHSNPELAYNDYASEYGSPDEPLRAGALPASESAADDQSDALASTASSDAAPARRASSSTSARSSSARAATPATETIVVPEETIGITPISASTDEDIVITAQRPVWVERPSSRTLASMYPRSLVQRGREGEASLHCIVQTGGALDCDSVSETPGFGTAAQRVAQSFRHAPTLADGSDAAGTPVNLHVVFRLAEERHG